MNVRGATHPYDCRYIVIMLHKVLPQILDNSINDWGAPSMQWKFQKKTKVFILVSIIALWTWQVEHIAVIYA